MSGDGTRDRWLHRLPLGAITLLLALVMVWIGVFGYLAHQRSRVDAEAFQTAGDLARGFGESVSRTLEAMDQVFAMLRAFHRANPGGFDIQALAPHDQVLNDLTVQMALTDARGMLMASNLGSPRVDLSDREHIRVHLERADDFLFVSKPVFGRVSQKWSIQLTRKLFDAQGGLAGVIVISLDQAYFARFYASFNTPGGAIALVGLDGIYRVRAPHVEGAHAGAVMMAQLGMPSATGTWVAISEVDDEERLLAYRRLDKYGLAVTVGLATREVYREFNRESAWFLLAGMGVTVLVAAIGWMLIRSGQRLLESQQALSVTLENMNQGIMMVDATGRVPVINHRAGELLELPEELVRPGTQLKAILQWQIGLREFGRDASDIDVDALARAGGIGPASYEWQRPNGTVLEVQTRRLPDGGAVRTFSDITDRRLNELALAAARDAAEAASRTRAEFMATMSHEIRTPLNGVVGIVGLLAEHELPSHLRRFSSALRGAAETLLRVIDDVLDFSKLDADRMELEEITFDLPELVGGVINLMEVQAVEKGLSLTMDVSAAAPALMGDPGRLRQVLLNLVGNAVKFTEFGGVHVGASVVLVEKGRVKLEVRVRDTGPGIAPEAQARLFEPFTQGDGSISRRYGGTGLGLAICRRLVERMGGSIALNSQPGVGSEFVFDVTMATAAKEMPAGHQAENGAAVAGRALRILLVEDNATNRMVAVTLLEGLGHVVDAVDSGEDALHQVQKGAYDLVLMDVMMPGMDGLAATRAIRQVEGAAATVPIVALTANVFSGHRNACRAAGMDDFLGKPLTPAALDLVLARAMNGKLRERHVGEAPDEVLARLAAEFGAEGAREVLAAFIDEARGLLALVRAKELAGDPKGRDEAVRVLSEAAETLGLTGLVAAANAIETTAPSERFIHLAALDRMVEMQHGGVLGSPAPA